MSASTRNRPRQQLGRESRPKQRKIADDPKDGQTKAEGFHVAPWTPSGYTAFKALLSARLCAAIWSHITDCDETYNYWEPAHYLMHGSGFQTWEYSPAYAIRSYGYLWLYVFPLKLVNSLFQPTKILQFYLLRCLLAFCCSLCEVYFYRAICKAFGVNTGRILLCFLVFSPGMYIASTAFLPSSFAMYTTLLAMAGWYLGQHHVAVLAIAAGSIIGWPFVAALGIPIAIDLVLRRRHVWYFIKWAAISLVVCLGPLMWIDSHYYGKLVITPLNIVLYNVFSEHGPNIYGVESWTFYFLNGFLNFNVVFAMALVALPVVIAVNFALGSPSKNLPVWLSLGPMYIWMAIFFTTPHKEERFLFPIYPLICLAGAVTLDHIQKLFHLVLRRARRCHYTQTTGWLASLCCSGFVLLALSRSLALFFGYHAPIDVYGELTKLSSDPQLHPMSSDKLVNVCVGKEWYRFSGSFFLPSEKWRLQFIKSGFTGQLPKPYESGVNATRLRPSHMNDINLEEPSRYIDVGKCHYIVDSDVGEETAYEPHYSRLSHDWTPVASYKFLDAARSHKFYRAFYIPFISSKYSVYVDYHLLRSTKMRKMKS